jgi:lactoylglutathione lyase
MKFLWTTIHVKDLDASVAFYGDVLELKVLQRFPAGPGREIVFLGNGVEGETTVELIRDAGSGTAAYPDSISLGFAVPSVDAMLDSVRARGIAVQGEPVETPKFKFFTIRDPDGVCVQLFQYK